ncbi:MAG: hypothetical protein IJU70_11150 [Lentisphaeria bacterium]|nr:hypothetical protein [Lentisphaeria bacterium]
MNIQPGRMTQGRRTSSARRDPDFGRQLVRVMKVLLFLVLVSGVLVIHIYMNQRIAETESRIRGVKQSIGRVRIEITNLRNRREEYCSPEVIRRQMVRFGLNLVPAEPGQVRPMAVMPSWQARRQAVLMEQNRSVVTADRAVLPASVERRFGRMSRD